MLDWLPSGAELQADVGPAEWIVERLRPWGEDGVRVWSVLPDAFEAFARILHPPRPVGSRSELPSSWRALAARRGVPLAPDVSFCEVLGVDPADGSALDEIAPLEGELPAEVCLALRSTLARHTTAPDPCWFWLWDGSGLLWSSGHVTLTARRPGGDGGSPAGRERPRRSQDELLERTPRVRVPNRSYFLVRGPLLAACGFRVDGWDLLPNLWHPDDRTWCVATEIDGYSTYVAGSRDAIDDVLDAPDLEAIEVAADTYLDVGPYVPRWRPRYPEQPGR
jgi:hypothetical protein